MDNNQPRWTDDDLLTMWRAGHAHAVQQLAEAADDINAAPPLAPPPTTAAQRLAQRRATLDAYAATRGRPDHPGGPVPWDTP